MNPIAIFRHFPTEGPGYFATFLESRSLPWRLVRIDAGDAVPLSIEGFSGLAFMGGPMSVNDPLPWIAPVLDLIRQAVARRVPVLGHCLGAQLMARALGGAVTRNPVKEIGWGEVILERNPLSKRWFAGLPQSFPVFHWHGETFSLPPGATPLMSSRWCAHQGFAVGNSLGLQCHIEMTTELVRNWCDAGAAEIERSRESPGVQPIEEIVSDLEGRVARLNAVAEVAYTRWMEGLA